MISQRLCKRWSLVTWHGPNGCKEVCHRNFLKISLGREHNSFFLPFYFVLNGTKIGWLELKGHRSVSPSNMPLWYKSYCVLKTQITTKIAGSGRRPLWFSICQIKSLMADALWYQKERNILSRTRPGDQKNSIQIDLVKIILIFS